MRSITIAAAIQALAALAVPAAWGQAAAPAAKVHVKKVGANYVKYTSKLASVVELNFTLGNTHQPGKRVISAALDDIARQYGTGGAPAFAVRRFASSLDGSKAGEVPDFTLQDLMAGEVIVANNVGSFGDPALGSARQQAIQRAIETEGRGYLGFHGSGDNRDNGWPWYTSTLHPMSYAGHGSRVTAPVYKHLEEKDHVILQGVLASRTVPREVPDELTPTGAERFAPGVPTRAMKNEWYRFGRDISRDAAFAGRTTVLLKYDARQLGLDVLAEQYRRKGGNMYTYLFRVGQGMTSYIPAGHENDELLEPSTGFDGGAGDFNRYVAQTLFFLAGYRVSVCDASCDGLPLVDNANRITGTVSVDPLAGIQSLPPERVRLDPARPAFSVRVAGPVTASLRTVAGAEVARFAGRGPLRHEFAGPRGRPGVLVLRVRAADGTTASRLYSPADPATP